MEVKQKSDDCLNKKLFICFLNREFLKSSSCMRQLRHAVNTFKKVFILIDSNEGDEFFTEYESLNLKEMYGHIMEFFYQSLNEMVKKITTSIDEYLTEV